MNWSVISILDTPKLRADTFIYLQRKRYGREPERAALALWKGVCTEPLARCILADLREVSLHGSLLPDDRQYLERLLSNFDLLSSGRRVVSLPPYMG